MFGQKIPSKDSMIPNLVADDVCSDHALGNYGLHIMDDADLDTLSFSVCQIARLREYYEVGFELRDTIASIFRGDEGDDRTATENVALSQRVCWIWGLDIIQCHEIQVVACRL